jgi:hypothetical protein
VDVEGKRLKKRNSIILQRLPQTRETELKTMLSELQGRAGAGAKANPWRRTFSASGKSVEAPRIRFSHES